MINVAILHDFCKEGQTLGILPIPWQSARQWSEEAVTRTKLRIKGSLGESLWLCNWYEIYTGTSSVEKMWNTPDHWWTWEPPENLGALGQNTQDSSKMYQHSSNCRETLYVILWMEFILNSHAKGFVRFSAWWFYRLRLGHLTLCVPQLSQQVGTRLQPNRFCEKGMKGDYFCSNRDPILGAILGIRKSLDKSGSVMHDIQFNCVSAWLLSQSIFKDTQGPFQERMSWDLKLSHD